MIDIDITMPIHIVNILILIAVMNAVLYRPIRNILQERLKKVAALEKDIQTFEKNTKLRIEEFDQKMAEARNKAKAEFESVKKETQAVGNEKLAGIKKDADAEKAQQIAAIEKQFSEAQQGLKEQLDGFANEMAAKILGRAVS